MLTRNKLPAPIKDSASGTHYWISIPSATFPSNTCTLPVSKLSHTKFAEEMQLEGSPLDSQFGLSQQSHPVFHLTMTTGKSLSRVTGSLLTPTHFRFFLDFFLSKRFGFDTIFKKCARPKEKSCLKEKNIVLHVSKNNINITILDTLNLTFVLFTSDVQVPSHTETRSR